MEVASKEELQNRLREVRRLQVAKINDLISMLCNAKVTGKLGASKDLSKAWSFYDRLLENDHMILQVEDLRKLNEIYRKWRT
jgi:hypothetical protein